MWGVRYRKGAGAKWKRTRTRLGKATAWVKHDTAERHAAKLRTKGYAAHTFQIVEYPNATHYSEHFTRAELNCKGPECAGKQPPAEIQKELAKLAQDLEKLRTRLGTGLGVMSGYRCPVRNKAVGGASQSMHMTGKAADLIVLEGQQDRYVAASNTVPAFNHGGIGVYPHGGVHVDRRGWFARWSDWVRT